MGRSTELSRLVTERALDLAVVFDTHQPPLGEPLARERGAWLAARRFAPPKEGEPWPLALFDAPCVFREAALRALDEARISWRIVYSTASLSGLLAAVRAGLAVTLRLARHSQKGLRSLGPKDRLPTPPSFRLALVTAEQPPPSAQALRSALRAEAKRVRT